MLKSVLESDKKKIFSFFKPMYWSRTARIIYYLCRPTDFDAHIYTPTHTHGIRNDHKVRRLSGAFGDIEFR